MNKSTWPLFFSTCFCLSWGCADDGPEKSTCTVTACVPGYSLDLERCECVVDVKRINGIGVDECKRIAEEMQPLVTAAYQEKDDLAQTNRERLADELAEQGLSVVPNDQLVEISHSNFSAVNLSVRKAGGDGMVGQWDAPGFDEIDVVYEIVSITTEASYLEDTIAPFTKHSHLVFLGTTMTNPCPGPQLRQQIGQIDYPPVVKNVAGNLFHLDVATTPAVTQTINTCVVDDGIRCAAEPYSTNRFLLFDDATAYRGDKTLPFTIDVIEILSDIVLTFTP